MSFRVDEGFFLYIEIPLSLENSFNRDQRVLNGKLSFIDLKENSQLSSYSYLDLRSTEFDLVLQLSTYSKPITLDQHCTYWRMVGNLFHKDLSVLVS